MNLVMSIILITSKKYISFKKSEHNTEEEEEHGKKTHTPRSAPRHGLIIQTLTQILQYE